jgi:hypothetical protein
MEEGARRTEIVSYAYVAQTTWGDTFSMHAKDAMQLEG